MWPLLRPVDLDLSALADRAGVTALATVMAEGIGGVERDLVHERMGDTGVLFASGFDLAMACLELLECDTGVVAVEWCRLFARAAYALAAAAASVTKPSDRRAGWTAASGPSARTPAVPVS